MTKSRLIQWMGFHKSSSSLKEKAISTVGGFLGILAVILVTNFLLGPEVAVATVPSLGASAVLLFAVPHGQLSQPWNVLGGHVISALVGVACAIWIPDVAIAAAAAVGLAIGAMYVTHCIHPPGGATALVAVIGGAQIQALGYQFIFTPILLNAVIIVLIAYLFNALFEWRRYPAFLNQPVEVVPDTENVYAPIKHEDFVYALSEIDSIVDITDEELVRIYTLAMGNSRAEAESSNSAE